MIHVKGGNADITFKTKLGDVIELHLSPFAEVEKQLNAQGYTLMYDGKRYDELIRTMCRGWECGFQTDGKHGSLKKIITMLKRDMVKLAKKRGKE